MRARTAQQPVWPVVLASLAWSIAVVVLGLPLTGGGHGPFVPVVVVVFAPVFFPLGILSASPLILGPVRAILFAFLALYMIASNLVLLITFVENADKVGSTFAGRVPYLIIWIAIWIGGQIAFGSIVKSRLKNDSSNNHNI